MDALNKKLIGIKNKSEGEFEYLSYVESNDKNMKRRYKKGADKNRYADICPYNYNMVKIDNGYINASWINVIIYFYL